MENKLKLRQINLSGNVIGFTSTFPINDVAIFDANHQKVQKEITYSRIVEVSKVGDECTKYKEGQTVILRKDCVDTKDSIIIGSLCTDTSMTILILVPHYNIVSIVENDTEEVIEEIN